MKTDKTQFINTPVDFQNPAQPQKSVLGNLPLALKLEHLQAAASVAVLGGGVAGAYYLLSDDATSTQPQNVYTPSELEGITASDTIEATTIIDTAEVEGDSYIMMAEEILEEHDEQNAMPSFTEEYSFGEAFRSARLELGSGRAFVWKGDTFSTFFVEEWEGMSSLEREDYLAKVYQNDEFSSSEKIALFENDDGQQTNLIDIQSDQLEEITSIDQIDQERNLMINDEMELTDADYMDIDMDLFELT